MAAKKNAKNANPTKKTYASACLQIADMHARGMSAYTIAKTLTAQGYLTAKGGSTWYAGTVGLVIRSQARAEATNPAPSQALQPSSQPAAPTPVTEPLTAQPAQASAERRGLKRMTRQGWESLPEPVREAVIERIYARVVGE